MLEVLCWQGRQLDVPLKAQVYRPEGVNGRFWRIPEDLDILQERSLLKSKKHTRRRNTETWQNVNMNATCHNATEVGTQERDRRKKSTVQIQKLRVLEDSTRVWRPRFGRPVQVAVTTLHLVGEAEIQLRRQSLHLILLELKYSDFVQSLGEPSR